VRAAIDYLLKESADPRSALRGLVDPQEIGIMGVSFGAWTTEAVSGFISSIPSFRDERIKAAAPIAGPAQEWRIGSFADIKIPVLIIFGEEETIVLGDRNSGRKTDSMIRDYETANPPKFLVEIKGAQHLDFGGAGVSRREQGGAGGTVSTVDVRNKDRVIATVNHYCIAFFRRYLGGNKSVEKELRTPGPNTVLLKYETGAR
jgi:predicted dienelactone hydrolase